VQRRSAGKVVVRALLVVALTGAVAGCRPAHERLLDKAQKRLAQGELERTTLAASEAVAAAERSFGPATRWRGACRPSR
jgi:hypothetical protein